MKGGVGWYPLYAKPIAGARAPRHVEENTMRDKLEKLIDAYVELEKKMVDPAVVSDPKEYARIAKEHASQSELVEKAREYVQALDDIEAAKEMLHEADADEKEMLQEDISANEAKLPELEALAAEEWDGAVVTLPVSVAQMHGLLQKMLEQDPRSFIAGL